MLTIPRSEIHLRVKEMLDTADKGEVVCIARRNKKYYITSVEDTPFVMDVLKSYGARIAKLEKLSSDKKELQYEPIDG